VKYIITIIVINCLVYIGVNVAAFSNNSIVEYLALSRSTVMGEPWTILTYMFTHMDFIHLALEMLILYFYGRAFCRTEGPKPFVLTYFIGGLFAGITILLLSNPMSYTIGSVAAIFAIAVALSVITPKLKVWFIPLWVIAVVYFIAVAILPNMGWQGHIGGLAVGLIAGFYLRKLRERESSNPPA
jgi:membrane associated rhomboid family serine protease